MSIRQSYVEYPAGLRLGRVDWGVRERERKVKGGLVSWVDDEKEKGERCWRERNSGDEGLVGWGHAGAVKCAGGPASEIQRDV